jgi:hypothetical protein
MQDERKFVHQLSILWFLVKKASQKCCITYETFSVWDTLHCQMGYPTWLMISVEAGKGWNVWSWWWWWWILGGNLCCCPVREGQNSDTIVMGTVISYNL